MLALALLVASCAAVAMGYLGVFVIFRRVALVGDALSHVALPGMALALALGVDVLWGAIPALLLAAVAVFFLSKATRLYEEAIVGILFSLALAGGVLLIQGEELEAALFGDILHLGKLEITVTALLSAAILILMIASHRTLTLASFSTDLALANGIRVDRTNLLFLVMLALAVALGVKVVGTLLVGSLVVIPASAASNLARSLRGLTVLSIAFAVLSVVAGLLAAHVLQVLPGPMVVLFEGGLFALSMLIKLAAHPGARGSGVA
jgi:ABC-type Mn2+/Zn2+ transport system permease subunit